MPPPITVATAPSGLTFAINLSDGQVIPPGTYTVTVTPLNGQGKSFAKVEFFVDGGLALSAQPTATGTFYWPWTTQTQASHTVKVVAYDADGAITTRAFQVIIRSSAAPATTGGGLTQQITEATRAATEAVKRAVRQIPTPVANAFPYLLFALLGLGLLMLVFQTRREIATAEAMSAAVERERAIAADKSTLVQLASHYLRTPLTLISNGLDLGITLGQLDQRRVESIKLSVNQLRGSIEQLLGAIVSTQVANPEPGAAQQIKIWLRPIFLLPILLLGGLTFIFNLLVIKVGEIEVNQINLIIQAAVFGLLTLGLYVLLRNLTLRRRDREARQHLVDEELALDTTRNQLILSATAKLTADVNLLLNMVPKLGESAASKSIAEGSNRFLRILAKFALAARLHSGHTEAPWQQFELAQMVDAAMQSSSSAALAKNINFQTPANTILIARHPYWIQAVLASLIENAVAYSSSGGTIAISAQAGTHDTALSVTDHGPGIAPPALKQLFRPFAKAEGALVFNHEGMGFSLFLDKLFMTYIGGDIALQSQLGKGTIATIRIFDPPSVTEAAIIPKALTPAQRPA